MEMRIPKNIEIVGISSPFYQYFTISPISRVFANVAFYKGSSLCKAIFGFSALPVTAKKILSRSLAFAL
jgi:hypothetical protein